MLRIIQQVAFFMIFASIAWGMFSAARQKERSTVLRVFLGLGGAILVATGFYVAFIAA